eukprot:561391-Pleurochrysis_carterae.AAC.1
MRGAGFARARRVWPVDLAETWDGAGEETGYEERRRGWLMPVGRVGAAPKLCPAKVAMGMKEELTTPH